MTDDRYPMTVMDQDVVFGSLVHSHRGIWRAEAASEQVALGRLIAGAFWSVLP